MSADAWYIDSSALVKIVVREPESTALTVWITREERRLATSELARVEVVRAVRLADAAAVARARQVVRALTLLRLDDALLDTAEDVEPATLRSLDAIHLAAALSLGADLAGIVTYDARLASGAQAIGIEVEAPA